MMVRQGKLTSWVSKSSALPLSVIVPLRQLACLLTTMALFLPSPIQAAHSSLIYLEGGNIIQSSVPDISNGIAEARGRQAMLRDFEPGQPGASPEKESRVAAVDTDGFPGFSSDGDAIITPSDAKQCLKDKSLCLPRVEELPSYKELSLSGLSKERWDKKDTSMLEGCWILGEEYHGIYGRPSSSERVNTIVSAERYCFDNNMHGTKSFNLKLLNGPRAGARIKCTVSVDGQFNGSGRLVFHNDYEPCSEGDGRAFESTMICTRKEDGTATCNGTNHGLQQNNIWFRKDVR